MIFRWLKSRALKYRLAIHETQRSPVDLAVNVLDFMQQIHQKVSQQNQIQKFVIDMEQTPVFIIGVEVNNNNQCSYFDE